MFKYRYLILLLLLILLISILLLLNKRNYNIKKFEASFYFDLINQDINLQKSYQCNPCKPVYEDFHYYSLSCKSLSINTTNYYNIRHSPDSFSYIRF